MYALGINYFSKLVFWIYLGTMSYGLLRDISAPTTQYPPGHWKKVIESQNFTDTLNLDTGDDNTLILNATFHDIDGAAITLRNVKNVYIKNCLIYNIKENGIVLRSTGGSQNVTIDGCTIHNIGRSGILAKRPHEGGNHTNLVIKNNTIYKTGKTEYDHSIYVQAADSRIYNNTLYTTGGNGVSIRTSGIVSGNRIRDAQKSCIRYYSNHIPGPSQALYIQNNLCYQTRSYTGSAGISLVRANETSETWLVQNYYVRFNTVVIFTAQRYGFLAASEELKAKHIEVYGNIFINTQDKDGTLNRNYLDYASSNYLSDSLKGFVNPTTQPYNFQLRLNSPARNYASREHDFPRTDINGNTRIAGHLDAGAFQYSGKGAFMSYLPYILKKGRSR
jgi:hypothetical protein